MAETTNLHLHLDKNIKDTAELIYSRYGLSLEDAVTVFIHQSCNVGGLPFDLRPRHYNDVTLAAMAEAEEISRNPHAKGYRDVKALFEELDDE